MRTARVFSRVLALASPFVMALTIAVLLAVAARTAPAPGPALVLDIKGAIGPATTEYIRNGLAAAEAKGSPIAILRMDTPGGLDSATRDIVSDILASRTPVAVFVAPAGARAASAGTYILYASQLAAMAPGTHLGAATPVQLGGGPMPLPGDGAQPKEKEAQGAQRPDANMAKAVNDASAYLASLAALNGRNAEFAERAVRDAATLTAEQALAQGVIELRVEDVPGLLAKAHGRQVRLGGRQLALNLAGARIEAYPAGWRIQALAAITNPNIAYLLLIIGFYGLLFEFMSPGGVGPGVFGAIALLVGFFGLNLLPVNYAGLALLALGLGLMALEVATPTVGVLGFAGAIAFGLGSLFLFKGPVPELRVAPGVVLIAAALSLAYFALALRAVVRVRRAAVATGAATLLDAFGRVRSWAGERGVVEVCGEEWQAQARSQLVAGQAVRVVGRTDLTLTVEPADSTNPSSEEA